MSSRCYLATSDLDSLYPSFVQQDYDPLQQTICTDLEAVPLSWMALFREPNIRREKFEIEGESIVVEAPIVERLKAIEQLDASLPYFNQQFKREGKLDEYFAQLKQALSDVSSKYVTIELSEIALMFDDDQWFYDEFRAALKSMDGKPKPDDRERILGITQIHDGMPFPPARMYLDRKEYSPEDQWNFTRILGAGQFGSAGWGRPAPWETKDASYGHAFTSLEDDDDLDFEDDELDEGEGPGAKSQ